MTLPITLFPSLPYSNFSDRLHSLELFSGGGGLALGTARAGFHHKAVIEWNRNACETLRVNRKLFSETNHWEVLEKDVREIDFSAFGADLDLLAGGAPCQPFSMAGKHLGQADQRNMFPEVFRAIRSVYPKAIILENVKGLLRQAFEPYFKYILLQLEYPSISPHIEEDWKNHCRRLERESLQGSPVEYTVRFQLINCAHFGIPQRRERVFIVAFRSDQNTAWDVLEPTHTEVALNYDKYVTGSYWDEHDMKPQKSLKKMEKILEQHYFGFLEQKKRWQTVRDAFKTPLLLPEPLELQETFGFSQHSSNPGARAYAGHTGSPYDLPAKTLKAGDHGVPGGENMLARADGSVRYFSIREAARLQTFPDSYVFSGAWVECFRQIGNAVPVELAQRIAEQVAQKLKSANCVTLNNYSSSSDLRSISRS